MKKLGDEYDNNYHRSIAEKSMDANYSALTEERESSHQVVKYNVGHKVRITKYKIFLAKVTLINSQNKYFWLILC